MGNSQPYCTLSCYSTEQQKQIEEGRRGELISGNDGQDVQHSNARPLQMPNQLRQSQSERNIFNDSQIQAAGADVNGVRNANQQLPRGSQPNNNLLDINAPPHMAVSQSHDLIPHVPQIDFNNNQVNNNGGADVNMSVNHVNGGAVAAGMFNQQQRPVMQQPHQIQQQQHQRLAAQSNNNSGSSSHPSQHHVDNSVVAEVHDMGSQQNINVSIMSQQPEMARVPSLQEQSLNIYPNYNVSLQINQYRSDASLPQSIQAQVSAGPSPQQLAHQQPNNRQQQMNNQPKMPIGTISERDEPSSSKNSHLPAAQIASPQVQVVNDDSASQVAYQSAIAVRNKIEEQSRQPSLSAKNLDQGGLNIPEEEKEDKSKQNVKKESSNQSKMDFESNFISNGNDESKMDEPVSAPKNVELKEAPNENSSQHSSLSSLHGSSGSVLEGHSNKEKQQYFKFNKQSDSEEEIKGNQEADPVDKPDHLSAAPASAPSSGSVKVIPTNKKGISASYDNAAAPSSQIERADPVDLSSSANLIIQEADDSRMEASQTNGRSSNYITNTELEKKGSIDMSEGKVDQLFRSDHVYKNANSFNASQDHEPKKINSLDAKLQQEEVKAHESKEEEAKNTSSLPNTSNDQIAAIGISDEVHRTQFSDEVHQVLSMKDSIIKKASITEKQQAEELKMQQSQQLAAAVEKNIIQAQSQGAANSSGLQQFFTLQCDDRSMYSGDFNNSRKERGSQASNEYKKSSGGGKSEDQESNLQSFNSNHSMSAINRAHEMPVDEVIGAEEDSQMVESSEQSLQPPQPQLSNKQTPRKKGKSQKNLNKSSLEESIDQVREAPHEELKDDDLHLEPEEEEKHDEFAAQGPEENDHSDIDNGITDLPEIEPQDNKSDASPSAQSVPNVKSVNKLRKRLFCLAIGRSHSSDKISRELKNSLEQPALQQAVSHNEQGLEDKEESGENGQPAQQQQKQQEPKSSARSRSYGQLVLEVNNKNQDNNKSVEISKEEANSSLIINDKDQIKKKKSKKAVLRTQKSHEENLYVGASKRSSKNLTGSSHKKSQFDSNPGVGDLSSVSEMSSAEKRSPVQNVEILMEGEQPEERKQNEIIEEEKVLDAQIEQLDEGDASFLSHHEIPKVSSLDSNYSLRGMMDLFSKDAENQSIYNEIGGKEVFDKLMKNFEKQLQESISVQPQEAEQNKETTHAKYMKSVSQQLVVPSFPSIPTVIEMVFKGLTKQLLPLADRNERSLQRMYSLIRIKDADYDNIVGTLKNCIIKTKPKIMPLTKLKEIVMALSEVRQFIVVQNQPDIHESMSSQHSCSLNAFLRPKIFKRIGGLKSLNKLFNEFFRRLVADPHLKKIYPSDAYQIEVLVKKYTYFIASQIGAEIGWGGLSLHEIHQKINCSGSRSSSGCPLDADQSHSGKKKALDRKDFERWMQIFQEATAVLQVSEQVKTEIVEYLRSYQPQITNDESGGSDEQLGTLRQTMRSGLFQELTNQVKGRVQSKIEWLQQREERRETELFRQRLALYINDVTKLSSLQLRVASILSVHSPNDFNIDFDDLGLPLEPAEIGEDGLLKLPDWCVNDGYQVKGRYQVYDDNQQQDPNVERAHNVQDSASPSSDWETIMVRKNDHFVLLIDPALQLIGQLVTEIFDEMELECESIDSSMQLFYLVKNESINYLLQELQIQLPHDKLAREFPVKIPLPATS